MPQRMRLRFEMRIYGYVVMPEHVHLLVSKPAPKTLADEIHFLKLSFTKRLHHTGSFWQKRFYDRNVRDAAEFDEKLGYIHLNPVAGKRAHRVGMEQLRHYSLREVGMVEIESEWTALDREMLASGGSARVFLGAPGKSGFSRHARNDNYWSFSTTP
jgi:putative transposase